MPDPLRRAGDARPVIIRARSHRTPAATARRGHATATTPARRRRRLDQRAHEGGADDDAVGVARDLAPPGARVGHAEADADRAVSGAARVRATSAAAASPTVAAGAGDAHGRGGVDEAAAGGDGRGAAGSGWRTARPGRPGRDRPRRCAASHAAASSGIRSGVISPAPAGGGEVVGEALDAVALDRVPVGHDQRRGAGLRATASTAPEHVARAGRRRAARPPPPAG